MSGTNSFSATRARKITWRFCGERCNVAKNNVAIAQSTSSTEAVGIAHKPPRSL